MARKKHSDDSPAVAPASDSAARDVPETSSADTAVAAGVSDTGSSSSPSFPASAPSILDEVQRFLEQREELLQKLSDEIEATEGRLAELRRTYQLIQAEATPDSGKDKKNKKPKPKSGAKAERRTSSSGGDTAGDSERESSSSAAAETTVDPDAFETPAE